MRLHVLEDKRIIRHGVHTAEVLSIHAASLTLRTAGTIGIKPCMGASDMDMFDRQKLADLGEAFEGVLRIDVLAGGMLRVRFAEGQSVPAGETIMLNALPAPADATWREIEGEGDAPGQVQLDGGNFTVCVQLDPYRIEVRDAGGRVICGASGREKNNFRNWDAVPLGLARPGQDERPFATESFDLRPDESIYGLGETFIGLDKTHQRIDLDICDAMGVMTPRTYKSIPLMVSSRGWGLFVNHTSRMTFWPGVLNAADIQLAVDDDWLDYFLILGQPQDVLEGYHTLTGPPAMPPRWSFGFWQSKISYTSSAETLGVIRRYRADGVPCDVIHVDTHWFAEDWMCDLEFDAERFPDPAGWVAELATLGVKVSLWQLPYIPSGSALFDELAEAGGFVKNAAGEIYDARICFAAGHKGKVGYIDFTNPAAVTIYQKHIRRLLELGVAAIKTDFGEALPDDGVYHDGTPGHQMHNRYPLLYNAAAAEVTQVVRGETMVWARSAWAGSQQWPVHWGGDSSPNWSNLGPQLAGGLSAGLSGLCFWSQDVGGFHGETGGDLLVRWMQMGVFNSHCRIHGAGPRELHRFGPEVARICTDYLKLRYRLLPYIFAAAEESVAESLPMMRPLALAYPEDRNVRDLYDQYLFGPSLLVAPIIEPTDRRSVYLPKGTWYCWWTGEACTGPAWIDVQAPLATLPLFVREGGIVPIGPEQQYVDERPLDALTLRVGLLREPGERSMRIPLADGGAVEVAYRFDGAEHVLSLPDFAGKVAVEAIGEGSLKIAT